jgi:hypothetical protein
MVVVVGAAVVGGVVGGATVAGGAVVGAPVLATPRETGGVDGAADFLDPHEARATTATAMVRALELRIS